MSYGRSRKRYFFSVVAMALLLWLGSSTVGLVCSEIVGCGGPFSAGLEVERVTSPDGTLDAVLTSRGGFGPTVGSSLHLYVVPVGTGAGDIPSRTSRLEVQDAYQGLDLRWRDDRFLEVRYEHARVLGYKNFDYVFDGQRDERYEVEIRLVPLTSESFLSR